jgi:hypothetical protein
LEIGSEENAYFELKSIIKPKQSGCFLYETFKAEPKAGGGCGTLSLQVQVPVQANITTNPATFLTLITALQQY